MTTEEVEPPHFGETERPADRESGRALSGWAEEDSSFGYGQRGIPHVGDVPAEG